MDFMISYFGSEHTGKSRPQRRVSIVTDENDEVTIENDVDVMGQLPAEVEEGNVEYKLKLVDPSPSRLEHLVTQMKWRLREGQGEAIYEIGVEDNGALAGVTDRERDSSLSTLRRMAERLGASVTILREREVTDSTSDDVSRHVIEVLIRKVPDNQQFIDLRVAVLGCADAGKSTLLGVLTQGEFDNGRGRARLNLFRHLHEIQTGRTSSISLDVLGFGPEGELITHRNHNVEEILEKSTKLITFIDLAGHRKFLKTTIFGLTGYRPHFIMLVVAANMGVVSVTKEHLGLAMALEVPIFVVVTKLDLVTPAVLERTLKQLEALLMGPACKRVPYRVNSTDDAISLAANFYNDQIVPIFVISSVTGAQLELLTGFLNVLPPRVVTDRETDVQRHTEFQIDEIFHIQNVGVVAAGLVSKGIVRENDKLLVGPTPSGDFESVRVESLHRNKAFCRVVQAGQAASIAVGALHDVVLRKGMVLVSARANPEATMTFEAEVYVLFHPSANICRGFQLTMHIGNVCQTATIVQIMDKDCIRTGESARVRVRFLKQPEYVVVEDRLLFREGRTKGIGRVTLVVGDRPGE